MRCRLLIPMALLAAGWFLFAGAGPAWANDGYGQDNYADIQGSGGTLTVQAGHTYWTPPADSRWATAAQSQPSKSTSSDNNDGPELYGCTYQADPEAQQTLGVGGPVPGVWMVVTCAGKGDVDPMPLMWVTGATPAAQTVAVNPVVVAEQAAKHLALGSPTIEMAPPDGSPQLVGVASWLWLAPGSWQTLTASASAGPVTATATATPTKVVWEMGNGASVTCDGPGTPYNASDSNASTDCSYTWPDPGRFTVTATVYWSVSWTATGAAGGGNLGVQVGPPAEIGVTVTESQAINTPTGGSN